jgi:type IV pilus assembly protein PilC
MPTFAYKAHDARDHSEVADSIEAPSQLEAINAIKRKGQLPYEVKESRAKASASAGAASPGKRGALGGMLRGGVKPAAITLFTRQFSTLQDAGLPIVQSLQILTHMQRPGAFKIALARVTEDVSSGNALSESLGRHPRIWDPLYTNLVKAGEAAGALETILRSLAEFREKSQRLRKKVIGAMIYPVAVLTIASAILTFIMVFIVPKFESIFKDLQVPLPALTVLLISFGRFMAGWWWMMLIGAAAVAVFLRLFRQTEQGAGIIDRIMLILPVLGGIVKKSSVARFTRTLGTLVTSGVSFLDALEITRAATPNVVVRDAITEVRESVKEGETINEPLRRSGVFDDIVVNMVKVGEETGELDRMLIKIADTYDEEVDAAVAAMMALLEPALIILMGGAVGVIVIALFMPLISILRTIGSQG